MRNLGGLLLPALLVTAAQADVVTLRNGNIIEGKVERQDERVVVLRLGELGRVILKRKEVSQVQVNDDDGRAFIEELAPVRPRAATGAQEEQAAPAPAEPVAPAKQPEAKPAPAKKSPYDLPEVQLTPEEQASVAQWVYDLGRQKSNTRIRAQNGLRALGDRAAPKLLEALSGEPLARQFAAQLLAEWKFKPATEGLIAQLEHEDQATRDAAAAALEALHGEGVKFPRQGDAALRAAAVAAWRKWFQAEREREKLKAP